MSRPSPLAEELHRVFHQTWGGLSHPLNLYVDSPIWEAQAKALLADPSLVSVDVARQVQGAWEEAHNAYCPMKQICTVHRRPGDRLGPTEDVG